MMPVRSLFVDAVHYVPHGPIDVSAIDCDLLVCSAYKFFGPHVGVLWGRYSLMDRLSAYKVRPARRRSPGQVGDRNTELRVDCRGGGCRRIPGVAGQALRRRAVVFAGRKTALKAGMGAVQDYEAGLSRAMRDGLSSIRALRIHGITDPARMDSRAPTYSFTLEGWKPRLICEELDKAGIYASDGNYYALEVTTRWAWKRRAAWCVWGPRTTIRSRRWTDSWRACAQSRIGAHRAMAEGAHRGPLGRGGIRKELRRPARLGTGAHHPLDLEGHEHVLDIGCGDGKVSAELARDVPQGRVVGVDSSEDMIRLARAAFPPATQGNLSFMLRDAQDLGFEAQFDVVFSNATLHWVKDHRAVLQSVARTLKPHGRILLQFGGRGTAGRYSRLPAP